MCLNKLSLKDKPLFTKMLGLKRHELSVYAFENIYIWKGLFDIYWIIIRDNLCVFFQDKGGCFLYLAPLGSGIDKAVAEEVFKIMAQFNKNPAISRIENIEEKDKVFYQDLGYECRYKASEYLCLQSALAGLKGSCFKSKRSCVNYFIKNYKFQYLNYSPGFKDECLRLYKKWMQNRRLQNADTVYRGMLEDNFVCLNITLEDYNHLDLVGRVVSIRGNVRGFTFGFEVNKENFCVLFEITDLSFKGLSQYIFQQFCAEFKKYQYINIMDDCGFENLKKVKLSYQPARLIPSYIVRAKSKSATSGDS